LRRVTAASGHCVRVMLVARPGGMNPLGLAGGGERRADRRYKVNFRVNLMRVRFPLEVRWEGLSGRHAARVYDLSLIGSFPDSCILEERMNL
jgi:hypothetical protein